jgi:hypothetical protein
MKLRLRAYDVVCQAVDDGVATGWRRAHKHIDEPDDQTILEHVANEVKLHLCEVIDFEDELSDE